MVVTAYDCFPGGLGYRNLERRVSVMLVYEYRENGEWIMYWAFGWILPRRSGNTTEVKKYFVHGWKGPDGWDAKHNRTISELGARLIVRAQGRNRAGGKSEWDVAGATYLAVAVLCRKPRNGADETDILSNKPT